MPTLLTVPRELRDKIIDLVILSTRVPPKDPTSQCDRKRFDDIKYHAWCGDDSVKHEANPECFRPNCLSLLLTNRQLSAETAARVHCMQVIECRLDVMLVNEAELWPTWTYLPCLRTHVDIVTATFRAFGQRQLGRRNRFRYGDGSPPRITWCFYSLLERFVKIGPVALRGQDIQLSGEQRRLTIGTLHLDFLTVTPSLEDRARDSSSRALIEADDDTEYGYSCDPPGLHTATPEKLCDFVARFIGSLLSMSYHTAEFGALLYERIGRIRVSVDGLQRIQWDLAEFLAKFPSEGPHEAFQKGRQMDFAEWRRRALRVRSQAGLPVSSPVQQADSSEK